MPDSAGGGCCRCCCSFIFTLGLSALFMWLSLRTSDPTFSIEEFSVVNTNPSSTNISFLLKLNNPNKDKGIYYDDVNLAFFLVNESDLKQDTLVANYTVPRFYQGHKKKAKKNGTADTAGRVKMTDVAAKNGTAFRVDLATAVRFKIMAWDTKRHRLKEAGVVSVNATGVKPKAKKGVKLKSGAVRFGVGGSWVLAPAMGGEAGDGVARSGETDDETARSVCGLLGGSKFTTLLTPAMEEPSLWLRLQLR